MIGSNELLSLWLSAEVFAILHNKLLALAKNIVVKINFLNTIFYNSV